jgi:hypothetical protein
LETFRRAAELGITITTDVYPKLEERMMMGGSSRLSLVSEDIDVLRSHCEEDVPGTYLDLESTFENDFGVDCSGLLCVFLSQHVLIFLDREGRDGLIYGFDTGTWDLIILGEEDNWGEVLDTFDTMVSSLKKKGLVAATGENRKKYKAGWRPSPLDNGNIYE